MSLAGRAFGRVKIDDIDPAALLSKVGELVADGGGTIFTPNLHHVALAEEDDAFAAAYKQVNVALCDGRMLQWLVQLVNGRKVSHLPGSVFLPLLISEAARQGWRMYFVGGRVLLPAQLPQVLHKHFPQCKLAGMSVPTADIVRDAPAALATIEEEIAARKPDIVAVSLPSPLQEVWAATVQRRLGHSVFVCTGSAIDRVAGLAASPPRHLNRLGLEWAWRISQEPRRLAPRYARDAVRVAPLALRTGVNTFLKKLRRSSDT